MKIRNLFLFIWVLIMVLSGCAKAEVATELSNFKESDMKVQLKTAHFIFYSVDGDKKCLDDLSNEVENNYERITSDLKKPLDYKPKVYVYPNLKSFHEAIGQPDAADWSVGTAWGKDMKMVSPQNPGPKHTYDSIKSVVVHEFVHVVQLNMTNSPADLPWLWEGVATFEANQMNDKTKKFIRQQAQDGKIPTLDQLTKDFYTLILLQIL